MSILQKILPIPLILFTLYIYGVMQIPLVPVAEAFTVYACYGTPYKADGSPTFYPAGSDNCFGGEGTTVVTITEFQPSTITYGQTSTISGYAQQADWCDGVPGSIWTGRVGNDPDGDNAIQVSATTLTTLAPGTYTQAIKCGGAVSNNIATSPTRTLIVNPAPPSAPTLSVTKGACGSGTLNASWSASAGATSYVLENWQPSSTWVTKATINPPTTSYSITGLTAGSPYSYRVKATNAGGSVYSNIVDAVAPSTCATPPPEPTFAGSCSLQSNGTYTIRLSWAGTAGAVNYPVRIFGPSPATNAGRVIDTYQSVNGEGAVGDGAPTASPFDYVGLTSGGSYNYWGHAWNTNGWSTNTARPLSCNPPTPTGFTATAGSCGTGNLTLSWNAVSGASSYTLYRSGVAIYTGAKTSYVDTGRTAGSSYNYTLIASAGGAVSMSASTNGTAPSACTTVNGSCSATAETCTTGVYSNSPADTATYYQWTCNGSGTPVGTNSPTCTAPKTVVYSCTGSIPANAGAYDAEESSSLTADTVWSYSGLDTVTKCQYRCTSGTWNGSSCAVANGADLIAGGITDSSGAQVTTTEGQSVRLYTRISNIGNQVTGGSQGGAFQVRYEQAADTNGTNAQVMPSTYYIHMTPLGAGSSINIYGSATFASAGTKYVRACADDGDLVPESNEVNNCGAWTAVDVSSSAPQATGNITPTSCEIPTNGSACASTVTWSTQNASNVSVQTSTTTISSGQVNNATGIAYSVPYGSTRFSLYNGGALLDSELITASCPANHAWVDGMCVSTLLPPTLTVSKSPVKAGNSVTLSWDTNNGDETSCSLNGKGVSDATLDAGGGGTNETGSVNVVISGRTTFMLTCGGLTSIKTVEIVPSSWET